MNMLADIVAQARRDSQLKDQLFRLAVGALMDIAPEVPWAKLSRRDVITAFAAAADFGESRKVVVKAGPRGAESREGIMLGYVSDVWTDANILVFVHGPVGWRAWRVNRCDVFADAAALEQSRRLDALPESVDDEDVVW